MADPKLLKAAADTINQELDSLRRHRDQLATWAKASADQSDRMRKLWKVAQTRYTGSIPVVASKAEPPC